MVMSFNVLSNAIPNLGDFPVWNNIAILLTIGVPLITFLLWIRRSKMSIYEAIFCRKIKIFKNKYYTSEFLINHIKRSKREVKIFCVRNIRISEPDVIKCFREFCDKGGTLELFVMSPLLADDIIKKIMITLPTEPETVDEYREQVEINQNRILQMRNDLGQIKGKNLHYYEYNVLPTIHLCQFDNKIYLGYQIFDNADDKKNVVNLGDYCSIIKTKSPLGKLILEQINYLRGDNLVEK